MKSFTFPKKRKKRNVVPIDLKEEKNVKKQRKQSSMNLILGQKNMHKLPQNAMN